MIPLNDRHLAPVDADVDPSAVSETQWAQWCEAVKRHDLGSEPLGRFARALGQLPGVLWHTPLSEYTGLTLEQLRELKTHGEKRVRAVIEVFAVVHSLLGQQRPTHLSVRIVPGFAAPVEQWLLSVAPRESFPSAEEVRQAFADPLIEQLGRDTEETVAKLVADRLLAPPGRFNVRAAAKELRLTRARVYQLLAEASAVLGVRWPEGSSLVHGMREKAQRTHSSAEGARLFVHCADLFYPRRAETAAGEGRRRDSVGRAQRAGNEADGEDQSIASSPRPPGRTRRTRAAASRGRKPHDKVESNARPESSGRPELSGDLRPPLAKSDRKKKPGERYCASDRFAASIDTSTCCPT
jgi:hypothetical protein